MDIILHSQKFQRIRNSLVPVAEAEIIARRAVVFQHRIPVKPCLKAHGIHIENRRGIVLRNERHGSFATAELYRRFRILVIYRTAQELTTVETFTVPCAVKAQKQPVSTVQQVEKLAYRSGVFLKSTRCGEPAGKLCHGAHNGVILVYLFRDKLI